MTNDDFHNRGSGTRLTVVALVSGLMVTSLVGGCCHMGHTRDPGMNHHFSEAAEATVQASAVSQLDQAAASRVWNKDKERAFDLKLSQLPLDKAYTLSLKLANLINTQQVRVDHGTPGPEAPSCTCSCGASSHSASTAPGKTLQPAASMVPVSPAPSSMTPAAAVAPGAATQKKP